LHQFSGGIEPAAGDQRDLNPQLPDLIDGGGVSRREFSARREQRSVNIKRK
jgi:hypothetical protein